MPVLLTGLAACATDPAAVKMGLAQPAALAPGTEHYVARADGAFTVPALPVAEIPPQFQRQTVRYETTEAPGTIIIDPSTKFLHFVTGKNEAVRYGIAVGRDGFLWSGEAIVATRKPWPTWTPPAEMIARDPKLAKYAGGQPGGLTNPLGSRALYLTTNGVDYGYRIHGTPDWRSIGTNASSGCIRMINQDVMDLYERAPAGAKVIVLTATGQMPTGLALPPPARKTAKVAAAPAVVTPAVVTPAAVTPAAVTPAPATEPAMPALPPMIPLDPALGGPTTL